MGGPRYTKLNGIRIDINGGIRPPGNGKTPLGCRFILKTKAMVVCECDCGNINVFFASSTTAESSKQCRCARDKANVEMMTTHGGRQSREYNIWCHVKARCLKPSDISYHNYGARGITVCDRWLNSFENFIADMGPCPEGDYSIDRDDVSKGYSPDNCKWATRVEQNNNRRDNMRYEFYGKSRTVAEWSLISLVKAANIYRRLHAGWPPKFAIWAQPGDVKVVNGEYIVVQNAAAT